MEFKKNSKISRFSLASFRQQLDVSVLRHLLSPEREKIGDSKFRNGTHRRRFRTVRFPLRASERLCYFVRSRCRSGVPLPWPARTRILVSWLVRAENNSCGNSYVDNRARSWTVFLLLCRNVRESSIVYVATRMRAMVEYEKRRKEEREKEKEEERIRIKKLVLVKGALRYKIKYLFKQILHSRGSKRGIEEFPRRSRAYGYT